MLTYTSQCAFVPQLVRYINARAMPPPMLQMVGCVGPIIALMNNGGWVQPWWWGHHNELLMCFRLAASPSTAQTAQCRIMKCTSHTVVALTFIAVSAERVQWSKCSVAVVKDTGSS